MPRTPVALRRAWPKSARDFSPLGTPVLPVLLAAVAVSREARAWVRELRDS